MKNPPSDDLAPIDRLLYVMAALRAPDGGCPWDLEQTFSSIAPYTIEEAYEVADAIERDDMGGLKEELGDLLLQVAYHARMAEEAGHFDFADVAAEISAKMVRRHPHVFAGQLVDGSAAQTLAWEDQKAAERAAKARENAQDSGLGILDGVARGLPGLTRAEKLQKRAARVGFDWPDVTQVFDKIDEELTEIKAELAGDTTDERLEDEVGDLLFVVANLARHLRVDPEAALRRCNAKFERRFKQVETAFEGNLEGVSLECMEAAWQAAKRHEK